jgi:hypothetical protein
MADAFYDGPFAVECQGPACDRSTLMEPGAPGPVGWLDLSVWTGSSVTSLAYFCSFECLRESVPQLAEAYGDLSS